jgi:hypothetical protein
MSFDVGYLYPLHRNRQTLESCGSRHSRNGVGIFSRTLSELHGVYGKIGRWAGGGGCFLFWRHFTWLPFEFVGVVMTVQSIINDVIVS